MHLSINCMPHYPPGGEGWGLDQAEINQDSNASPFWKVSLSNPHPCLHLRGMQLCGDLIKPKVEFPTLRACILFKTKSPKSLTLPQTLKMEHTFWGGQCEKTYINIDVKRVFNPHAPSNRSTNAKSITGNMNCLRDVHMKHTCLRYSTHS